MPTHPPTNKGRAHATWTTARRNAVVQAVEGIFGALYKLQAATGDTGESVPGVVHLSSDARALWTEWYAEHAVEMAADDFNTRLRGAWAKMPSQLARLALILHVVICVCFGQDPIQTHMTAETLGAAADLASYFKAHARRVYRRLIRVGVTSPRRSWPR